MKKSRFTESQIVAVLKEGEAGIPVVELCRKHGISSATYYQWKSKYSGVQVSELHRLRELEAENAKLKRMYQRKRRYTDEQKHQAVDHYIEHGQSLMHTIRCLGYPGRETLRIWIGELRPDLRKIIAGSTTPHNMPRSHATKRQAVVALNTRSGSAKDVAEAVGVTRETLYSWHHQLLGYAPLKPMPKKTDTVV